MNKIAQFDLSKKLQRKRKEIDLVDRKLLSLLNHRLRVALECGKIKKETGKKAYDPTREKEVRDRLKIINRGPLNQKDLEKIFKTIIGVCRKSQK
jgi:chorismate mutase